MKKTVLRWNQYKFELSLPDNGEDGWLDLLISSSSNECQVYTRVMHVVDAKVWERDLKNFVDSEIDDVEVFKMGADFSIVLNREEGVVNAQVNLNPDSLLETSCEELELGERSVEELVDFSRQFVREYETLLA